MLVEEQPHSRVVYLKVPKPLTEGELLHWFTLASDERQWAPTISRWEISMLALLTQLKVFQQTGRCLPLAELPQAAPTTLNDGCCTP